MPDLNISEEQYRKAEAEKAARDYQSGTGWIDAVKAAAPHLQSHPLPVSGDLVDRMLNAFRQGGMTAALRVAAEEIDKAILATFKEHYWHGGVPEEGNFAEFRNYVRARLFAQPDPAVEAVKAVLKDTGIVQGSFLHDTEVIAAMEQIVAAVRAADAKGEDHA